jgi:uncharacterized protein YndB with AHSA1/START domain
LTAHAGEAPSGARVDRSGRLGELGQRAHLARQGGAHRREEAGLVRPSRKIARFDARQGRLVSHRADGGSHPFTGESLEVVPPERFVWPPVHDVLPFNEGEPGTETHHFEHLGDGRTRLRATSHFPSVEALKGALATGMIEGGIEVRDRLAEDLARG